jgi:N-methylhydantoinase A
MRYVGQAFEVSVPLDEATLAAADPAVLTERFNARHARVFEFAEAGHHRVEVVSFRLGIVAPPGIVPSLCDSGAAAAASAATRLYEDGRWLDARLLNRAAIRATGGIRGTALVEDATSTVYVATGWRGRLDGCDNLILTRED